MEGQPITDIRSRMGESSTNTCMDQQQSACRLRYERDDIDSIRSLLDVLYYVVSNAG